MELEQSARIQYTGAANTMVKRYNGFVVQNGKKKIGKHKIFMFTGPNNYYYNILDYISFPVYLVQYVAFIFKVKQLVVYYTYRICWFLY